MLFGQRKLNSSILAEPHSEIKAFTDDELNGVNNWSGGVCNPSEVRSATRCPYITACNHKPVQTVESGIVDLRRIHNVYISSVNLSSFQTLGPRGERNSIKKVPKYNIIRFYNHG